VEADGHEGRGATRDLRPIHGPGDAKRPACSTTSGESTPTQAGKRRQVATLAYAYALLPIRTEHITDSFQMT